ncbi:MAG: hypothetical protein ACREAE_05075 [Nitrosopumilaceae archaeon]
MIKILIIRHSTPDVRNYSSILFENLLQVLKNRTKLHLTWFVYLPEKLKLYPRDEPDTTILDIHDFENAVGVIQREKPDIIYALIGPSVIDYAFVLAAQFFNIPIICGELDILTFYKRSSKKEIFRLYLTQLFQNKLPIDTDLNQKRFMKRFRFFVYKHLFLLRTLQSIKMSRLKIFGKFFLLLRFYLVFDTKMVIEKSSPASLHFLYNDTSIEPLIKIGFERSSLVVTGDPTYDNLFRRLQQFRPSVRNDDKIHVLIVTSNPNDPGGRWRKKLRDMWLKSIVMEITKHKDTVSLAVKIHPTGESLSEYHLIVNTIDPDIPVYQKGDIIDFLTDTDVVIGSTTSTALVCALIAKKPIIIWNFANVEGDAMLECGLVLECKEQSSLIPSIHQILSSNPASPEKVEKFIHKYLYKSDGRATERIADAIMELLKRTKNVKDVSNQSTN